MSDGNGVHKFPGHCKMRDVFIGSECFTNSKKQARIRIVDSVEDHFARTLALYACLLVLHFVF